ncbi:hypothetical protein CH35J_005797 [Colletotrichum higginsianum]|uniref:Uncharacterized protein n=1 Tax=Colletotrichum higginsianum TaxID=80884 RepID=A0A4T0W4B5_9PEZI|nr:hypothetical protein CH35J_005797 [Colletotrichum higginsianum]
MASSSSILYQEFPNSEERKEFIAAKFGQLLSHDKELFARLLKEAREIFIKNLLLGSRSTISEYWFDWMVYGLAWKSAMEHVPEARRQPYPWQLHRPPAIPKNLADEATWFLELKKERAVQANLTPGQRLQAGLPLMEEEPPMKRTTPGMSPIAQRQKIWDAVFPGKDCAEGRPFEFAAPSYLNISRHVRQEHQELRKWLPACVRVDLVDRECPEGSFVDALVFGYVEGTADNPMNRMCLALVYKTAVAWARKVFITRRSTPISQAFKDFNTASVLGDIGITMEQLTLDDSLSQLADAQLALGPHRSEADHAAWRVAAWLDKNKENTSPAQRCAMLRDWCSQRHVNLESLSLGELRQACRRAWEESIKKWKAKRNPPLYLQWNSEKEYAAEVGNVSAE